MKSLLCLFAIVFAIIAVTAKNVNKKYPRYLEYPDENGIMRKIDLKQELDMKALDEVTRNPADNEYLLFTRRNQNLPNYLIMDNADSVAYSNFNAKVPTAVIVHGWLSNQNSDINPTITEALLRESDMNVIVVDWSRLSLSAYNTAASGVPDIGLGVGQFLAFINNVTGAPYNKMHLIGFSLGAHVVGNAGRELGGKVARITGLDPAGPLWSSNSKRLNRNDAVYVEAIHTNGDALGFGIDFPVGKVDFFANGGKSQPGCWVPICDHSRAWELFASSVNNTHLIGKQCKNMREVEKNKCNGENLPMGNNNLNKKGNGLFRVNTEKSYPF